MKHFHHKQFQKRASRAALHHSGWTLRFKRPICEESSILWIIMAALECCLSLIWVWLHMTPGCSFEVLWDRFQAYGNFASSECFASRSWCSIFFIHLHTFLFDPFRLKAFILKPGHVDRHSSSAGYVVASSSVFVVCSWHAVAVYLVIQPNCTFSWLPKSTWIWDAFVRAFARSSLHAALLACCVACCVGRYCQWT